MEREFFIELIKKHVKNDFLFKHMLASEAIMRDCAKFLNEDAEKWGLFGLLHDIDFEYTKENPKEHGIKAEEILEGKVSDDTIRAIKSHNYANTNIKPETKMEICFLAVDAITGLIIACALVKEKKLENVSVETIENSFKKKGFAAGSNRLNIQICERIGISLKKFFEISLDAMQKISKELRL